jgi:hypothetical protein
MPLLSVLALVIWVAVVSRAAWLIVHPSHDRRHRVTAG